MKKSYDERYFKRWYSNPRSRIATEQERARQVSFVLATSEFLLGRRVRSVLDIGCGEGRWYNHLTALRPRLHYMGIDSSEYAVSRFGRVRNIHAGSFANIHQVVPLRDFDLIIASDVIHYLTRAELERGLPHIADRMEGVAYLNFFCSRDPVEGDLRGLRRRTPGYYLKLFASYGIRPLGMQLWAREETLDKLAWMEGIAANNQRIS